MTFPAQGGSDKPEGLYKALTELDGMRSPADVRALIEDRLARYLKKDRSGIRRAMLRLFIEVPELTIGEIHARLSSLFPISLHSVAATVGIISTRLGLLHVRRNPEGTCCIYQLKGQYVDLVRRSVTVA
jgi:hypothetical protein